MRTTSTEETDDPRPQRFGFADDGAQALGSRRVKQLVGRADPGQRGLVASTAPTNRASTPRARARCSRRGALRAVADAPRARRRRACAPRARSPGRRACSRRASRRSPPCASFRESRRSARDGVASRRASRGEARPRARCARPATRDRGPRARKELVHAARPRRRSTPPRARRSRARSRSRASAGSAASNRTSPPCETTSSGWPARAAPAPEDDRPRARHGPVRDHEVGVEPLRARGRAPTAIQRPPRSRGAAAREGAPRRPASRTRRRRGEPRPRRRAPPLELARARPHEVARRVLVRRRPARGHDGDAHAPHEVPAAFTGGRN